MLLHGIFPSPLPYAACQCVEQSTCSLLGAAGQILLHAYISFEITWCPISVQTCALALSASCPTATAAAQMPTIRNSAVDAK